MLRIRLQLSVILPVFQHDLEKSNKAVLLGNKFPPTFLHVRSCHIPSLSPSPAPPLSLAPGDSPPSLPFSRLSSPGIGVPSRSAPKFGQSLPSPARWPRPQPFVQAQLRFPEDKLAVLSPRDPEGATGLGLVSPEREGIALGHQWASLWQDWILALLLHPGHSCSHPSNKDPGKGTCFLLVPPTGPDCDEKPRRRHSIPGVHVTPNGPGADPSTSAPTPRCPGPDTNSRTGLQ